VLSLAVYIASFAIGLGPVFCSARARSQKQQEEASRHTAPDARERIPTGAGEAAVLSPLQWIPTIQL